MKIRIPIPNIHGNLSNLARNYRKILHLWEGGLQKYFHGLFFDMHSPYISNVLFNIYSNIVFKTFRLHTIYMKKLIKGLHQFQTEVFPLKKDFFEELVKGQKPEALFITCSDSRINPNLMTSAEPGELFILRNTGTIIPPYGKAISEAATIEFAVCELGVKNIILCGHLHCGALEAATDVQKIKHNPSLYFWLQENVIPTVALVKKNYRYTDRTAFLNILVQEHVLQQIENLKTHPVVKAAIAHNMLALHVWIYKFETGDIAAYDPDEGQFKLIKKSNF